jgi:OOP family OmpA-OmpF porin
MSILKSHLHRHFLSVTCLAGLMLSHGAVLAREAGQDHPAVTRYPGATIAHYDFKEFEQAQLILSKPYQRNGDYVADKVLPLEGAVTYIHYEIDKQASALQVFRNYQSMLRRSGFKELFVCERPCIRDNLGDLKGLLGARSLYLNGAEDIQYVAAQRGNTYVSLAVNSMGSSTDAWLLVIDKGQLDDGKMGISGDSPIAKALSAQGRVDLYGFYFDTGKSSLKKGSEKTLNELAQVLQDNPTLKIQVLGHTDNVGQDADNQQLSQERAQSVVNALSEQQGIDGTRLEALGLGASQPIAPNSSEKDRARNRRVEIVAVPDAPSQTAQPSNQPTTTSPQSGKQGTAGQPREVINTANEVIKGINSLRGLFGR